MWPGRTTFTEHVGGRHGGPVRLDDTFVPRGVTLRHEGQDGAPDLEARFEVRDGRPECVDFRVTVAKCGRGLRTGDLSWANIDNLTVNVFAEVAVPITKPTGATETGGWTTLYWDHPASDEQHQAGKRDVYESRKRSRGTREGELVQVAEVYRQHVASAPTRMVAELLGYSDRTAARRVSQARERGLLPATTPGKRKA